MVDQLCATKARWRTREITQTLLNLWSASTSWRQHLCRMFELATTAGRTWWLLCNGRYSIDFGISWTCVSMISVATCAGKVPMFERGTACAFT